MLDHFGSIQVEELLDYVVNVFGEDSPLFTIIMSTLSKAVTEVYETVADKLRAEGHAAGRLEGRAMAKAEAVLGALGHRAWSIPAPLRDRVLSTSDEQLLQRWFDRAFTARSIEEVFRALDA